MSGIFNIIWIIFGGGLVTCLEYLVAGLGLCVTIIGIPFGIQCFKLAGLALVPFGKEVGVAPGATGCISGVMNVVWFICAGIWIAITHALFGIVCAVTIIGIPFAIQHLKLAQLALTPFGREIREK